jgi:hypothetical protein
LSQARIFPKTGEPYQKINPEIKVPIKWESR